MSKLFITISIICFLSFTSWHSVQNLKKEDCKTIRLQFDYPLISSKGEIINLMADSIDIHYVNDFTVYHFYIEIWPDVIDENYIPEYLHEYFIFRNNDREGYLYDKWDQTKICSVDSLLKEKVTGYGYDMFTSIPIPIHEIQQVKIGDTLVRQFLPDIEPGPEIPDTIKFFFLNHWRAEPFMFSPVLDKQSNSKAFKSEKIFNSRFYKQYEIQGPKRVAYIEMRPIENTNDCPLILEYIEKVKALLAQKETSKK